jgi:hypothetical protein
MHTHSPLPKCWVGGMPRSLIAECWIMKGWKIDLVVVALAGAMLASLPAESSAAPFPGIRPLRQGAVTSVQAGRPEIHSYQPYSGLQFGFRPRPPTQRGATTDTPRVIMPKRIEPLLGYGDGSMSLGYGYCAEPFDGTLEPKGDPYGSRPVERRQCP